MSNLLNGFAQTSDRTRHGRISKREETLLRATKGRNLWRSVIAHVSKEHGIKEPRLEFNFCSTAMRLFVSFIFFSLSFFLSKCQSSSVAR